MITLRPRRSVLYMPGSNARAIEKAKTLPADAVVFDLEDAVAPDAKDGAREAVAAAVAHGGYRRREVVMRVNALDTPWGEADLMAAAKAGPDAILLPKVSTPETLVAVGLRLRKHGAPEKTRVWAMIETPLAILNAKDIAETVRDVDTRLDTLVLGLNDLSKETGTRQVPGRAPMLAWIMTALAAARAHDLAVIDGVYGNLSDDAGFRAECEQGRDLGFDGKSLIHPNQIAAANEVFAPDPAQVAEARAILSAFEQPENVGRGVISLGGKMVERLHADMAARVVAMADAIADLDAHAAN
jgi:citrate lyase subunit beta/citryl-CoA lyase